MSIPTLKEATDAYVRATEELPLGSIVYPASVVGIRAILDLIEERSDPWVKVEMGTFIPAVMRMRVELGQSAGEWRVGRDGRLITPTDSGTYFVHRSDLHLVTPAPPPKPDPLELYAAAAEALVGHWVKLTRNTAHGEIITHTFQLDRVLRDATVDACRLTLVKWAGGQLDVLVPSRGAPTWTLEAVEPPASTPPAPDEDCEECDHDRYCFYE